MITIIYMLFYCWSCIIGFASSDLRSMNLLYLRYCYLILSNEYVMSIYMYQRLMAWLYGYDISELIIMQDIIDWWNQHIMIKWKERDIWYGLALSYGTARQELMPGTAPTDLQVDQPARSSCLRQPARSLCLGQPPLAYRWISRPGAHAWDSPSGAYAWDSLSRAFVRGTAGQELILGQSWKTF